MAKVLLRKNEERRVQQGHLWVFSNEIEKVDDAVETGDIVEIYSSRNVLLGTGFYNKNSLIAVRLLSNGAISDLYSFFCKKITDAYSLRKELYPERNSFRLVFSESDFLPGLIIDKYNNTYVLQVYSAGMEKNISLIVKALQEELNAVNIFSKNEGHFRKLEGLPEENTVYAGSLNEEIIDDGKIKYRIDFEKGHKTGFYFDQSDNRFFMEKLCKGKTVIDAFCNSGGFGLHAASSGAAKVTFVDSSSNEIDSAKHNFELNGFNCPAEYTVSDVFDFFEKNINNRQLSGVVIIDPPAFAKSRKNLPVAKKGYERLNKLAMQTVMEGGYLVTSSCSYHLSQTDFLDAVLKASLKAGKKLQLVYFNTASLDHPELPGMNETSYLKFAVFKVYG